MKKLLILLLFVCGYAALQAQNLSEAKSARNYYGEATASGEDAAVRSAKTSLIAKFKPDMMQDPLFRKADVITCGKMADQAQVVVSGSGNRTTAVAYIPKEELRRVYAEVTMFDKLPDDGLDEFGVPIDGSNVAAVPASGGGGTTNASSGANVANTSVTTTSETSTAGTGTTSISTAETSTVANTTVANTTTANTSATGTTGTGITSITTAPESEYRPVKTGNPILDEMIEAINIIEISELLTKGKNNGSLAYGRLSTMTSPENSYLLVYKPDGTIVAIYDKGSAARRNLRTGNTENYRSAFDNVKFIWFQLYN